MTPTRPFHKLSQRFSRLGRLLAAGYQNRSHGRRDSCLLGFEGLNPPAQSRAGHTQLSRYFPHALTPLVLLHRFLSDPLRVGAPWGQNRRDQGMRAGTTWALGPHDTNPCRVGAPGNPEVPTIVPSQRHRPRALGTPYEAFPHPATQQLNHIFAVTLAIRAAIKYDQDADGGWSGYRGEASTSSIRCPSSLSFHVMPLSSTGLPPFSSQEAVQFNQNALTYCQLPRAGTRLA